MQLLNINDKRYILKGVIRKEKLNKDDKERIKALKSYLKADTMIEQKSRNVWLFTEEIQEAEILEEIEPTSVIKSEKETKDE